MTNWFYEIDGKHEGPVDAKTLKQLANQGVISPETTVWQEGGNRRVKAAAVKGLIPSEQKSAPPPLPKSDKRVRNEDTEESSTQPPKSPSIPKSFLAHIPILKSWLMQTGQQAVDAGRLGKLLARKAQIETTVLPPLFNSLGRHLFETKQLESVFQAHFARIEQATAAQAESSQTHSTNNAKPTKHLRRVMFLLKAKGETAANEITIARLFRRLGSEAYASKQRIESADEVINRLESANEELLRVRNDIAQLEGSQPRSWITPKRILIAGAVLLVISFLSVVRQATDQSGNQRPSGPSGFLPAFGSRDEIETRVGISGTGLQGFSTRECNNSIHSLKCSIDGSHIFIALNFDASKWQPVAGGNQMEIRLFDESGHLLTGFRTERLTVHQQVYDNLKQSYDGCVSARGSHPECDRFKCVLLDGDDELEYAIRADVAKYIKIAEIGFVDP